MSTIIVMIGILLSRVLGFFREWTVAHEMGANAATSAYYAAFTLPDFLNYLLAGGSLSVTFIPVFNKYVAENSEEEAWRVFSTVVTFMGILLTALVVVGEMFTPQLAQLITPGFHGQERERMIFLTRVMLPAQFFFILGSILSAVQYAKGRFVIPSVGPVVYNAMIIVAGVLLARRIGISAFAFGVLGGSFAGIFLIQVYGAFHVGARFKPNLNLRHPGFRMFLTMAIPIMLALGLPFMDDFIITRFGSYLQPASIAWLNYAKNLMQVPLGVVGQAVGVASFPFLSQLYSEGKFEELNRLLDSTFKGIIALLVPISALAMAQSAPVVYLAFAHTRMVAADLQATATTLIFFSVGMFAWGAQYILARGFYATRSTMIPAIVGTALTFASLPLYWVLVRAWQHLGLALASSLAMSVYAIVLFFLLNRRTHNQHMSAMLWFFVKICGASALVGWICHQLEQALEPHLAWHRITGAFLLLTVVTSVGILLLIAVGKLLRIRELEAQIERLWTLASWNRSKTPA